MNESAQSVLAFWFDEIQPQQWWQVDPAFDRQIANRFGSVHAAAARCECQAWRGDARGRLAEVIVLDQFSRNIHRGTPAAFACDALALGLAQEAVRAGAAAELEEKERNFLLLPWMHSESPTIHAEAVELFRTLSSASTQDFERRHKAIIDRFGRYPHRNAILGRTSSAEELAFLQTPGSSF